MHLHVSLRVIYEAVAWDRTVFCPSSSPVCMRHVRGCRAQFDKESSNCRLVILRRKEGEGEAGADIATAAGVVGCDFRCKFGQFQET